MVEKLALDVYVARDSINLLPKWGDRPIVCDNVVILPVRINEKSARALAYVVSAEESEIILGTDFMVRNIFKDSYI